MLKNNIISTNKNINIDTKSSFAYIAHNKPKIAKKTNIEVIFIKIRIS